MKSALNMFGYVLCLFGAAFAGFPPPRSHRREETPDDVLVRLLDDEAPSADRTVLEEWGFRVVSPGQRREERQRRRKLDRSPRPPLRRLRPLITSE